MGIDINGLQLLIRAHRSGVSFKRMAMLGRQGIYANRPALVSVLREAGYVMSQDCVSRLLDPGTIFAEDIFSLFGAKEIIAIDVNNYEGAQIIHDMNQPIPEALVSSFDVVLDGGTLEHVFNFPVGLQNAAQMVCLGGSFLAITMANNFCGHGFYQFSPELFYRFFCPKNGYALESCILWEDIPTSKFYSVPDPESVQSRIDLTSDVGAYMMIQAKRMGSVLREFIPYQSDYVRLWDQPQSAARSGSALRRLKAILGRSPHLRSTAYTLHRLLRLKTHELRIRSNRRGFLTALPELRVTR